jgi:hypothetical protein
MNGGGLNQTFDFDAFINSPDVRTFIGRNYEHYKSLWSADYAKKQSLGHMITSWHLNWLALLAGPVTWYAYRKMFGPAIGLILGYCALTLYQYYNGQGFSPSIFIGGSIGLAFIGKGFYLAYVIRFFEKNKNVSRLMLEQRIASQGGASTPFAVAAFILMIAALTASAALGETLFGPLQRNLAPP